MKFRPIAAAAAVFILSTTAQAHTHLEAATPADNSVLASAPAQVTLHFSEPTRLTALSIQKDGTKEQQRIDALPKEPSEDLTVPVLLLAPGKYVLNWRAIGADNHVMSGALHYTITGKK